MSGGRFSCLVVAIGLLAATTASGAQRSGTPNDAALDRLIVASNAICVSPGDYGYSAAGKAGAGFSATLPKLLAKLFAFGLSGSIEGGAEVHKGISQKDVGPAATARNDCAARVFVHLVDRFSFTDLSTGAKLRRPASPSMVYAARAPALEAHVGTISAPANTGFVGVNQGGAVTINNNAPHPAFENKDRIVAIAILVKEANAIADAFAATDDTKRIQQQYADWYSRADAYLVSQFDPSYSAQFEAAIGNGQMLVGRSIDGGTYWAAIRGKNKVLTEMLSELRH